ncbi:hypothetical protein hrd7_28440 [Leptolinea sp. HRD-7]|nr:hypothetical protein hrd7_28440 [Leptolinea sp. HRD-7]
MSIREIITPTRTPLPQGDSTGQLELTVNLGKKVYHVGEEIIPYVKIRNAGTNNVLIRNKFSPGFDHNEMYNNVDEIFLGPTGKPVINTIIDIYYLPYPDSDLEFQVIYPNHEFTDSLNPLELNYRIQETGKYTYQIKYRNHLNPTDGREAWKGTLTSNTVEFEILP